MYTGKKLVFRTDISSRKSQTGNIKGTGICTKEPVTIECSMNNVDLIYLLLIFPFSLLSGFYYFH